MTMHPQLACASVCAQRHRHRWPLVPGASDAAHGGGFRSEGNVQRPRAMRRQRPRFLLNRAVSVVPVSQAMVKRVAEVISCGTRASARGVTMQLARFGVLSLRAGAGALTTPTAVRGQPACGTGIVGCCQPKHHSRTRPTKRGHAQARGHGMMHSDRKLKRRAELARVRDPRSY